MPFCPHYHKIAYRETLPGTIVMFRLRCKSWSCAYCAKINRSEWQKHLRKMLPRISDNWWFVTITAHEHTRTAELSLNNIRSNIDRLFKRIKRVWKNVQYVRVYETHEKGAYHAHMVLSGLTDHVMAYRAKSGLLAHGAAVQQYGKGKGFILARTWFRRTCRSMGMGYKVDVQAVATVGRVTGYVIKYLTKEAAGRYVKGLRRIVTSRKVGSPHQSSGDAWTTDERVFLEKLPTGATVYDADTKLQIPDTYWQNHLAYPEPGA